MNYGAIVGAQIAGRNARAIAEQRMIESAPQPINTWAYGESALTVRDLIIITVVIITPFLIWGIVEFIREYRRYR